MVKMGLLGKKLGMTQIFVDGDRLAVTAVELGPNVVVQKKTPEGKDGYGAIQLGFGDKEHRKTNKPMTGHFKRTDVKPQWVLNEIRINDAEKLGTFEEGQVLTAEIFNDGDFVDVTSTSQGKGFAGVMKKHHMKGAKQKTHGTHEQFRHVGSIGCRSTPGEVHKGKRLPGQMGNKRVTVQNIRIAKVDHEKNLVLLHGSVPGPRNGYVLVRQAVKKTAKN